MPQPARRFDRIPPEEPRLLEGLSLFNQGKFFESHEAWEALWHEVAGPERELLQGLIQIAAAYHHLQQGNAAGAQYLHARGRARLAPWLPSHAGLALSDFLTQVDADLAALGQGRFREARPQLRRQHETR